MVRLEESHQEFRGIPRDSDDVLTMNTVANCRCGSVMGALELGGISGSVLNASR